MIEETTTLGFLSDWLKRSQFRLQLHSDGPPGPARWSAYVEADDGRLRGEGRGETIAESIREAFANLETA